MDLTSVALFSRRVALRELAVEPGADNRSWCSEWDLWGQSERLRRLGLLGGWPHIVEGHAIDWVAVICEALAE